MPIRQQQQAEAEEDVSARSVNRRGDLVSAAILALLLPYGYSLAYAYAYGQAAYWGIPTEFISVEWEASLAALSAVIGLFLVAAFVAFVLPKGFRTLPQVHLFAMLLLLTGGMKLLAFPVILILASLVVTTGQGLFCLVAPALKRDSQSYERRLLERAKRRVWNRLKHSPMDSISELVGHNVTIEIVIGIVLLGLAFAIGNNNGRTETQFWLSSDQKQVLLATYGDTVIFGSIDHGNRLSPYVHVSKLQEKPMALVSRHIDHLVPIGGNTNWVVR